ncbi:hypothetical protein SCOCK_150165 [Actinacidiphila cocklensis]|uniref:Uncharacterized protein n=1 Tax=Actinacidiphila cocklensis TaxID=887465 RepID=A0A9W4DM73_9ACTN|nr:hypothetical protein SCOCK_150165 [Actinacidiphila cocklensis]
MGRAWSAGRREATRHRRRAGGMGLRPLRTGRAAGRRPGRAARTLPGTRHAADLPVAAVGGSGLRPLGDRTRGRAGAAACGRGPRRLRLPARGDRPHAHRRPARRGRRRRRLGGRRRARRRPPAPHTGRPCTRPPPRRRARCLSAAARTAEAVDRRPDLPGDRPAAAQYPRLPRTAWHSRRVRPPRRRAAHRTQAQAEADEDPGQQRPVALPLPITPSTLVERGVRGARFEQGRSLGGPGLVGGHPA